MGNLGGYQRVTTVMKTLGGPGKATTLVLGGVFVAGGAAYAGGQRVVRAARSAIARNRVPCATKGQQFDVHTDGATSGGLSVQIGDRYRVLDCDGDAILIDRLGDAGSPYFASAEFLSTVSDFPQEPIADGR